MILAYAVAVYLPITYTWAVLIPGIVVWVLLVGLELAGAAGTQKRSPDKSFREWMTSAPSLMAVLKAPLALPFFVFSLTVLITAVISGGIGELKAAESLRAMLVYFVAYSAFSQRGDLLNRTLAVFLSMGAIAGVWGAIQQVFDFHPFGYKFLQGSGFINSPMAYAGQMEVVASLALALFLSGGFKQISNGFVSKPFVFGLITAANLAGIFFASERSGWLGMLFSVLTISYLQSRKMFLKCVVALTVVLAIAWFTVPVLQTRIVPLLNGENIQKDVSVQARFIVWHKAIEVWQSSPIVGVGVRHFPKISMPGATAHESESSYLVHAHNNYLHILSTMGIIGLVSFLYLQIMMLIVAFKEWRAKTSSDVAFEGLLRRGIGLGAIGGIVSLMVAGLFEYNFGTGHVRLIHWFVLGMLNLNLLSIAGKNEPKSNVLLDPGAAVEAPGGDKAHEGN